MKYVLDSSVTVKWALAEREQCPLVTADEKLVALFPSHAVSLASL